MFAFDCDNRATPTLTRTSLSQRIVLLIGSAAGLFVFGRYLTHFEGRGRLAGWTGYAPLVLLRHGGIPPWGRLLIWLALVAIWTAFAYWLLRSVPRDWSDDEARN